jgi:SWI/SNF-related matrix-associated actin-dependent regulator of chromatin subfamily A-like protein 1
VSAHHLTASLDRDEAVLRFPYDEDLRQLLRAIPGRRWDPSSRTWRVPLGPDQAEAVGRILEGLPFEADIDANLARALERRRARRDRTECLLELARPDGDWWLSFATDGPAGPVEALLEHPLARPVEEIGRALVPLDDQAVDLAGSLSAQGLVRLSATAARAIEGQGEPDAAEPAPPPRYEVEFRRDRRGLHWILIAQRAASLARVLAAQAGLRPVEGPEGSVGLAASEADGAHLQALVDQLEDVPIDPRVQAWLRRVTSWRGNIEVAGSRGAPVLLLLGDARRLPPEIREQASTVPEGVSLPLTLESWRVASRLDGWAGPAVRRCVSALEEGRPAPPAVLELSQTHEDETFVLAPGHDPELPGVFAHLEGAMQPRAGTGKARGRREHEGFPALRADPFCVPQLDRFLAETGTWVEEEALETLQQIREEHARSAGLVALSAAHDAELEVPGLGGELKPFQRAGVAYLLERRRAFLADEQGLGKTIEALATLEADGAFPAIVVCPANLKLNWLREIEIWLPGRTARALSGEQAAGTEATPADITVLNYDIVGARLAELVASGPQALVIDEAHYCKNQSAKRTRAVQQLAAEVPAEGIVLALSGTPVVNRPAELIPQLRILGRLSDFGSGARFGARFRGADAHHRLHWHLRARCFVRRLKQDVLPQLPAKTRAVVPIELENHAEYRLAEADLLAWLRSQPLDLRELDAKLAAALRAERLVRLSALKLLAARGKLTAALAWMHDFCSSGERLVVFAHHREVQAAVLQRFPGALHILGQDSPSARDAALQAFQAPDDEGNQLIVCSMEVAGQGLTLTRSSNVAFLELDWTPAKHDQAEDRCHRIGQQDAVNAYYLLAADTVDETIGALLERKRAVIAAVTDGTEHDEEGIVDALVRELRATPYRHLRAVA